MIKNEISLFNRKVTITKWLSGFSVCDRFIFWFWREGDSELTLRSVDDSSIFGIFLSPCPRLFFLEFESSWSLDPASQKSFRISSSTLHITFGGES